MTASTVDLATVWQVTLCKLRKDRCGTVKTAEFVTARGMNSIRVARLAGGA
jgi:hypothetical protein